MQHLEGSGTPVLYIGRTVFKGYFFYVRYSFLLWYVWLVLSISLTLRLVMNRTPNKW